jgi:HK97 family phage prohead protease
MNKDFRYGHTGIKIKSVDSESRIVSGYASAFNNVDLDNDMILPGAFAKTITERGPSGKNEIFFLHNHSSANILGKPTTLKEDSVGLYFEAKIAPTRLGDDILALYKEEVINQHSIGFSTIQGRWVNSTTSKDGFYEISEVKLYEFSSVLWGANPNTPFLGMKGEMKIDEIFDRLEKLHKSLRSGQMMDETYAFLELEVNQLKSFLKNQFGENQKPKNITSEDSNPNNKTFDQNKFLNALKSFV